MKSIKNSIPKSINIEASNYENIITIDESSCSKCGMCSRICESETIIQLKNEFPKLKQINNCKSCGHCVAICPNNAIIHKDIPAESLVEINKEKREVCNNLSEVIASRRSCRNYKNKPLESEKIKVLLSAGAQAPTAKNRQWRYFIVITDKELINKIEQDLVNHSKKMIPKLNFATSKIMTRLMNDPDGTEFLNFLKYDTKKIVEKMKEENAHPIFYDAPCLILTYAWKDSGLNGDPFAKEHCIYANSNIVMQATEMGLGTCIIGYASTAPDVFKEYIEIPKNHKIYSVITVGYPKYTFKKKILKKPDKTIWIDKNI